MRCFNESIFQHLSFGTFSQLLKLQVKNKKMIVLNLLNLKKNSTSLKSFHWGGSSTRVFVGVSGSQKTVGHFELPTKTWNPKQQFFIGCFHWMIPNLYIGNGCFTKHLFINGCFGYQEDSRIPTCFDKLLVYLHLEGDTVGDFVNI